MRRASYMLSEEERSCMYVQGRGRVMKKGARGTGKDQGESNSQEG
jgi:hypothetical protein